MYNSITNPLNSIEKMYPLDEIGNGEFFAACYRNKLMYSDSEQSWYIRSKSKWFACSKVDATAVAKEFAKAVTSAARADLSVLGTSVYADRVAKYGSKAMTLEQRPMPKNSTPAYIRHYLKLGTYANVVNLLLSSRDNLKVSDVYSHRHDHLVCPNATLKFNPDGSHEVIEHDEFGFYSKSIRAHYSLEATCPRWLQFIEEITCGDVDMAAFLQREMGRCLTGDNTGAKLNIIYGSSGSNGKTLFTDTVSNLLGDYSTSGDPGLLLSNSTSKERQVSLSEIAGMNMVVVGETPKGSQFDDEMVKSLVNNGEYMSVRKLYQSAKMVKTTAKLWLSTNYLPTRKMSPSLERRINFIHFQGYFGHTGVSDDYLGAKLKAEYSGILNWLIEGYAMTKSSEQYNASLLDINKFNSDKSADVDESVIRFSSLLSKDFDNEVGKSELASVLYKMYVHGNYTNTPVSMEEFPRLLRALGFKSVRKMVNGTRSTAFCLLY